MHKYAKEENNLQVAALNRQRPVCCLRGCGCNDMCNDEVHFFEGIPEYGCLVLLYSMHCVDYNNTCCYVMFTFLLANYTMGGVISSKKMKEGGDL